MPSSSGAGAAGPGGATGGGSAPAGGPGPGATGGIGGQGMGNGAGSGAGGHAGGVAGGGVAGGPNDPTGGYRGLANQIMFGERGTPADPSPQEIIREVAVGGHGGGFDPYAAAIQAQQEMFAQITEMYQPYRDAGLQGLNQMRGASTIKGLDRRLGKILDSDTFGSLYGERKNVMLDHLSQSGLTRSGAALTELADLSTQTGLDIEGMLYGRSAQLAGMGLNATHGNAGAGQNMANQVSNVHLTQAGHELQQMLAEMGFAHTSSENALNRDFQAEQNALDRQFNQNIYNDQNSDSAADWAALGMMAIMAFSDRDLKTNITKTGEAKGLNIYEWDWIDSAPDFVKSQPNIGFMADEVEDKYPQFVHEIGGYKAVDYSGLVEA